MGDPPPNAERVVGEDGLEVPPETAPVLYDALSAWHFRELQREREARGLVEEELRLLRQSLAMQEVERLRRQVGSLPFAACQQL